MQLGKLLLKQTRPGSGVKIVALNGAACHSGGGEPPAQLNVAAFAGNDIGTGVHMQIVGTL